MTKRNTGIDAILQAAEEAMDDYSTKTVDQPSDGTDVGGGAHEAHDVGCAVKQLPSRLLFMSAELAARINPVNAPGIDPNSNGHEDGLPVAAKAAVVTSKYWGPRPRRLTVSFMDNPATDLRRRILLHLNAWTRTGCIEFVETRGTGQIRISRGSGGYWSYLGTDVLLIPQNRATMNLQSFTMTTPETEYRRVIRHEAGHTLGMPHEHMRKALVDRIDREKAYEYFARTQGWDRTTVDQQVLTALNEATLMFTPADQDSIMCYQLPGSITKDGRPITGGRDINATDYAFVGRIYPRPGASMVPAVVSEDDWPESEDVSEVALAAV